MTEVEEKVPGYVDHVGFNDLYVVKGIRGIFITVGKPNSKDYIGLREWGKKMIKRNTVTVKVGNLTCLGSLVFATDDIDIVKVPVDTTKLDKIQEKFDEKLNILMETMKLTETSFNKLQTKYTADRKKVMDNPKFKYKDTNVPVTLGIKDVFNNLHGVFQEFTIEPPFTYDTLIAQGVVEDVMQTAVPNYNEDMFKKHHLRDCIKWFNLTRNYLVEFDEIINKDKD